MKNIKPINEDELKTNISIISKLYSGILLKIPFIYLLMTRISLLEVFDENLKFVVLLNYELESNDFISSKLSSMDDIQIHLIDFNLPKLFTDQFIKKIKIKNQMINLVYLFIFQYGLQLHFHQEWADFISP